MHRSLAVLTWAISLGAFRELPAQVVGVPTQPRFLVYSRAAVAAYSGFAGAGDSHSGALAASASVLVGPLILNPMASMAFPLRSRSFRSYGASIEVIQWIDVGVAYWDSVGTRHVAVPIGVTIPLGWCVRSDRTWLVWAEGRREFQRVTPPSRPGYGDNAWAYTLGFSTEPRRGFGFQFAGGSTTRSMRDWSLSAGLHLLLRALPKETRTEFFSDTDDFPPERPCSSLPGELARDQSISRSLSAIR